MLNMLDLSQAYAAISAALPPHVFFSKTPITSRLLTSALPPHVFLLKTPITSRFCFKPA